MQRGVLRRTLLAAATGLLALAGAHGAQAENVKATLRLKWLTQAQFAGFYVAVAKGYYAKEGIDLTINPGGPNLLTENLVATGADTFGLSGGTDSVFAARDKGLPIICIGIAHQHTPFVFVAHGDGPIKTLQDFKGKKVSTWFTGAQYVLWAMLGANGIDKADVNIVPQQVSITPFVDHQMDVVTATLYNELNTIKERGVTNLKIFAAEDYGVSVPRDTLIVAEKTAAEHPKMVEGFLKASIEGWKEAFKDPKGAIDIVMKAAPALERKHQELMLAEIEKLMKAGQVKTKGLFYIDPDAVKKAHDLFLANKVISKPVDISKAYVSTYLDAIPVADRLP